MTFELTYEELLARSNGQYDYQLQILPRNQKVKDFSISIMINETLPLKDIEVKRINDMNEIEGKAQEIEDETLIFDEKNGPSFAMIQYKPSLSDQGDGKDWKMSLKYDVKRPLDGNDIQIAGGRFVHYFSPDSLPTMNKHIIFVIDLSGSMHGRKLVQTIDAMTTILESMLDNDRFNILAFSDTVMNWAQPDSPTLSLKMSEYRDKAIQYALGLKTLGGTNINDAMIDAIKLAEQVKTNEEIDDKAQQMIIFLTDGEPTTGETNSDTIKANIKTANSQLNVPVYGLALGNGADFGLIQEISDQSEGFARRIYESGNSFEQLENFYKEVSDPKLKNVHFKYIMNGQLLNQSLLTSTLIKNAFGNTEYAIVGSFGNEPVDNLQIILEGEGEEVLQNRISILPCIVEQDELPQALPILRRENNVTTCLPPHNPASWQKTEAEAFMERLWAFKRIKYLLSKDNNCHLATDKRWMSATTTEATIDTYDEYNNESEESTNEEVEEEDQCEAEALKLALKYNFVTKITSMVVEADDKYVKTSALQDQQPSLGHHINHYFPMSATTFNRVAFSGPQTKGGNSNMFMMNAILRKSATNIPYPGTTTTSYRVGGGGGAGWSFTTTTRPPPPPMAMDYSYSLSHSMDYESMYDMTDDEDATNFPMIITPPTCTGKALLYQRTYLRDQPKVVMSSQGDLGQFEDLLASLEIEGSCCWRIFTDKNFGGSFTTFKPGKYESATQIKEVFRKASSIQMVQC